MFHNRIIPRKRCDWGTSAVGSVIWEYCIHKFDGQRLISKCLFTCTMLGEETIISYLWRSVIKNLETEFLFIRVPKLGRLVAGQTRVRSYMLPLVRLYNEDRKSWGRTYTSFGLSMAKNTQSQQNLQWNWLIPPSSHLGSCFYNLVRSSQCSSMVLSPCILNKCWDRLRSETASDRGRQFGSAVRSARFNQDRILIRAVRSEALTCSCGFRGLLRRLYALCPVTWLLLRLAGRRTWLESCEQIR